MHFSQWDHVRAPPISVTLRLTIPGILFLTHAFRQPQPHNLTFPLTCISLTQSSSIQGASLIKGKIFHSGSFDTSVNDVDVTKRFGFGEQKERACKVRTFYGENMINLEFLRQNFAKGAARHYLSSEGKEQRGLLYVHRQSRHFSPSC